MDPGVGHRRSGGKRSDVSDRLGIKAPVLPALPALPLPDWHRLLQSVDAEARGFEGVPAVRCGHGDQHGALTDLQGPEPMQQGDPPDRRPVPARLGGNVVQPALHLLRVGLVLELADAGAALCMVPHRAAEYDHGAARGNGHPRRGALVREGRRGELYPGVLAAGGILHAPNATAVEPRGVLGTSRRAFPTPGCDRDPLPAGSLQPHAGRPVRPQAGRPVQPQAGRWARQLCGGGDDRGAALVTTLEARGDRRRPGRRGSCPAVAPPRRQVVETSFGVAGVGDADVRYNGRRPPH